MEIRLAQAGDTPLILKFIRGLAEYEKLEDQVVATEEALMATLFGETKYAEVLLAFEAQEPAGFALFFHNYSTFLAQPGIYLEDLFVDPKFRGKGIGNALIVDIVRITKERNCGRIDWAALDWNTPAHDFYLSLEATKLFEWIPFRLTADKFDKLLK